MNFEKIIPEIYEQLQVELLKHQELFHIQATELNKRLLRRKMAFGHLLVVDDITKKPVEVGKTRKTVKLKQPSIKADLLTNYLVEILDQGMVNNFESRGINRFKKLKQHELSQELTKEFYTKKLERLIAIMRQEISYLKDMYDTYVAYKVSTSEYFFIIREEDGLPEVDKYGNILLLDLEAASKSYLEKVKDMVENINDTILMYAKQPVSDETFDAGVVVSNIFASAKKKDVAED